MSIGRLTTRATPYPQTVVDYCGREYSLLHEPEDRDGQHYVALYRGADGREYTPHLPFVTDLESGRTPEPPIMMAFGSQ